MIMREGRQKQRKQYCDLGYMFYCFLYILQHLILISLPTLFIMNYFVVVVIITENGIQPAWCMNYLVVVYDVYLLYVL